MRVSFFTILVFLLSIFSSSQTQDLENLADGEMVYADILYDSDHNLYGYIYFFDQGKIDAENKQFEYILLDRNLNKVANGTYQEKNYDGISSDFFDCTFMGEHIIFSKYYIRKYEVLLTFNRIISLKDKSVSKEFIFENNEFRDLNITANQLKDYKNAESINITYAFNHKDLNGFFVSENNKKRKHFYQDKDLKIYDSDKNLKWAYVYNENGSKKDWNAFRVLNMNEGLILGGLSHFANETWIDSFKIVGLEMETGQKRFKYELENKNAAYSHSVNIRYFGDKIYIVGNYSPYSKDDFNWMKNLGIYQVVLDQNGNEITRKYHPWSEIAKNMEANKYGVVEKGYYLSPKKFFIMKDGSFVYLAEKFKGVNSNYTSTKTLDFVLFNFDNEGNFKENHTIEKDKTKWAQNDYLFHQYIKDNSGVVFFFRDHKKDGETKDKNWVLGINTVINTEFKQELVPMSSDDFFIQPIPAKEGYILLREFNKKSEFDQLRLERLNY
ncbi:DUF6770 family protein [Moheibacter lacus]|uniref:DKNYY family protein n=1 Tax=Moheibacter lacus TaxID=2745851 RepID=A0A838ZIZ5_9FLAO|nr:DUF6770 family protein [Moheibacter lacus]MBA5629621.1 hypothetical protein [Moheibacter lacus]